MTIPEPAPTPGSTGPAPAATLTPSIVGQAEKAHNAILFRVLNGTGLDEKQWITLVLALGAGRPIARAELIDGVSRAAHYPPSDVDTAISALTDAALLARQSNDSGLTVTEEGRDFAENVRAKTDPIVERAYGVVPDADRETAARVLTIITARLSDEARRPQPS
jgi:hypothetical protein